MTSMCIKKSKRMMSQYNVIYDANKIELNWWSQFIFKIQLGMKTRKYRFSQLHFEKNSNF